MKLKALKIKFKILVIKLIMFRISVALKLKRFRNWILRKPVTKNVEDWR